MRRYALLAALLASALTAYAQAPPLRIDVGAGPAWATRPDFFRNVRPQGFALSARAGFASDGPTAPFVRLAYQRFAVDDTYVAEAVADDPNLLALEAGPAMVATVAAGLRAYLLETGPLRLFALGELGLHYVDLGSTTLRQRTLDVDLDPLERVYGGLRLGAGADLTLGERLHVWAEPAYTIILSDAQSTQFLPILLGLGLTL